MLEQQTISKLKAMRLSAMATCYEEQIRMGDINSISFDERLALMVDREESDRANRRLASRIKKANFREQAYMENLDFSGKRLPQKKQIISLCDGQFARNHKNILIHGSTGSGKTFLACALGHKMCLLGYSVRYLRAIKFFPALNAARGDGSHPKLMDKIAKTQVVILDDFGITPLTDQDRRDLYEIMEDRYKQASTIITSQFPVNKWHQLINDPTLADAILDRIVHNSYEIQLESQQSRRKIDAEKDPGEN